MVAVIKYGKSISRIFNYNENKVKSGVAKCVLAANYPMESSDLTLTHKLNRLLNQANLNDNLKNNSMHISLNFAKNEDLNEETLKEISIEYMEAIGFGNQPFLVYKHHDAAHPHIHIVSTIVRADGSRIDIHNIGRSKSEPARKAIEKKYNLVKAEQQPKQQFNLIPIKADEVVYGKIPTKRAISNVLDSFLNSYQYTSIPELNALLKNYHVYVDRGKESTRTYQHKGLYYGLLDKKGKRIGVPIKASLFHQNPGLKFLEERFEVNAKGRKIHQYRLKKEIDGVLNSGVSSLSALEKSLKAVQIQLVPRTNAQGVIYGLTYIDHRRKCVFNGSALGKNFSAKAILNLIGLDGNSPSNNRLKTHNQVWEAVKQDADFFKSTDASAQHLSPVLESFLEAEQTYEPLPYQLKKSRKKKKRKHRNITH